MTTAKQFLFEIGVTNDPDKTLIVKCDDKEFDIAHIMETYLDRRHTDHTIATFDANFPHLAGLVEVKTETAL